MPDINPKQIYIIHARTDAEQVKRLSADLSSDDIHIWVDDSGLKAGTHDWEDAVRDAIHNADVVLFAATPNVRRLPSLRDELALAFMESIAVYPLWFSGNQWRECVPSGYELPQYIDMRESDYETGLEQIRVMLEGDTDQAEELANQADVPPLESDAIRRSPYKGLNAFTATDAHDYFGREALLQELIEDVRDGVATLPFLCLVGASGTGKSSLLQAGLLPALRDGEVSGSVDWLYTEIFTPGIQPMLKLAGILQRYLPETPLEEILTALQHPSTNGLHRLAQRMIHMAHQRLVIVIDSFEELFTLTPSAAERKQFMDVLITAAEIPDSRVLVITALNAEYYDRPLQYAPFGRLLEERHRAILPFTLTELYHAIQNPARLSDVQLRFEKQLVGELAFALRGEQDALPLLQLALTQLFYRRNGDMLTWAAYRVIGGIHGVVDVLAERTMSQLFSDEHRATARVLFLRLIRLADNEADTVPQVVNQQELTSSGGVLEETITAFVNTGLLINETQHDATYIRITHPIVIRRWQRLQQWLQEAREDQQFAPIFVEAIAAWQETGQPQERLYRGIQLERALLWSERNNPTVEAIEFIQQSMEQREIEETGNRRSVEQTQMQTEKMVERIGFLRKLTAGLLAAGLVVLLIAGIVFLLAQRQRREVDEIVMREPTLVALQASAEVQMTAVAQSQTEVASSREQIAVEATVFAADRAFQGFVGQRAATLAAGSIFMPLADMTVAPTAFFATQTQIAALNTWQPVEMLDAFGIPMLQVPAGCFYMGSISQSDEQPPHQLCFDAPFWIDKYEMTNDFFQRVANEPATSQFPNGANPVDSVSWFEARDVCALRDARLPTESEWEYAARGVDSLTYPWGNQFIADNLVFGRSAQDGALPVISGAGTPLRPSSASWVGAVDMLGNIEEWTSTIYDELDFSRQTFDFQNRFPYPYRADDGREADESRADSQERMNSTGIFTLRVLRGGSYIHTDGLRSANRSWDDADDEDITSGFRCART
jgi:formylglycine-generating enzyme required for sulfatase activity